MQGKPVCYACAALFDMACLAIGQPRHAYLHGTGEIVTTWPGIPLARVTWRKRLRTRSIVLGEVWAFNCEDCEGRRFFGRAGLGGVCLLRPMASDMKVVAPPTLRLIRGG